MDYLGGLDELSGAHNSMTVFGGFSTSGVIENTAIIGEKTKTFIKNKIIEWDSFKNVYYKNNILDPKHYAIFLQVIPNIFLMPEILQSNPLDDTKLLFTIDKIYKSKPIEIMNAIEKTIDINSTIKYAIQHQFMIYKMYIEKLIETYINLRESYISEHNLSATNKENKFNDFVHKWNVLDTKNKINTSSPILFFNFPITGPKKLVNIEIEKTIPKFDWYIKTKNKKITESIQLFISALNKSKFEYLGFCIHDCINRFKLLLTFPAAELVQLITLINGDQSKIIKAQNDLYILIISKISNLSEQITHIQNIKNTINTKDVHKDLSKNKLCQFNPKTPISDKIKCFEFYINAYLQLYIDLSTYIIKKEKSIVKLSTDINSVSQLIQSI